MFCLNKIDDDMPNFSQTEANVISLFPKNKEIVINKQKYLVQRCCKPRPSDGECKTDVYLELLEKKTNKVLVYKISIKQDNADFLENKMSYERAVEIFGGNAMIIISDAINRIKQAFEDDYLICFQKYKRTEAKTIKIGWKFELMNKLSGEKSALIPLTSKQKLDVYSGINLATNKKNSYVDDVVVENSGVADYLLIVSEHRILTAEKCIESLIPLNEYVKKEDVYFACKAINYRVDKDKWDGDRPLSVWVDWTLKDGKLDGKLNMTLPLTKRANEIGNNIRYLLKTMKVGAHNFDVLKGKITDDVRYY